MAIDVKRHKKKVLDQKPNINLVPFIDILFTIMIFLVVTMFKLMMRILWRIPVENQM